MIWILDAMDSLTAALSAVIYRGTGALRQAFSTVKYAAAGLSEKLARLKTVRRDSPRTSPEQTDTSLNGLSSKIDAVTQQSQEEKNGSLQNLPNFLPGRCNLFYQLHVKIILSPVTRESAESRSPRYRTLMPMAKQR